MKENSITVAPTTNQSSSWHFSFSVLEAPTFWGCCQSEACPNKSAKAYEGHLRVANHWGTSKDWKSRFQWCKWKDTVVNSLFWADTESVGRNNWWMLQETREEVSFNEKHQKMDLSLLWSTHFPVSFWECSGRDCIEQRNFDIVWAIGQVFRFLSILWLFDSKYFSRPLSILWITKKKTTVKERNRDKVAWTVFKYLEKVDWI